MPSKPDIFVGRDNVSGEVVQRLISTPNARLAILGPGGFGKTSLALAVMADRQVIQVFRLRFWVPCVEATSVALFLEIVATSMGLTRSSSDRRSDVLDHLRISKDRQVLLLDNFETPWDISGQQNTIESLLGDIVAIPSVSILITTRAYTPPSITSQLKWSEPILPRLDVLSLEAARELFVLQNPLAKGDPCLDELLAEMEYIPLAITLMAKVGLYGDTASQLLTRWRDRRESTKLLDIGNNRLSSVGTSIQLSIDSGVMKSNPEALALLSVLSELPAGAHRDFIPSIAPELVTSRAIVTLLQATLVTVDSIGQVIRVLAPIRVYMRDHYPPTPLGRKALTKAYFSLLEQYAVDATDAKWKEATRRLKPEQSNLEVILLGALLSEDPSNAIDATFRFASFQRHFVCRSDIIQAAIDAARRVDSGSLGKCLDCLGDILIKRGELDIAERCLNEAIQLFQRDNNEIGEAGSLRSLGEVFWMRGQYEEAKLKLQKARFIFKKNGHNIGAAGCIYLLGRTNLVCSQLEAAGVKFNEARLIYQEKEQLIDVAKCDKAIGELLIWQNQLEAAEPILKQARKSFKELEHHQAAAECLYHLGIIFRDFQEYDEAENTLNEARREFEECLTSPWVASCLLSLGTIYKRRRQYPEAEFAFATSLESFMLFGDTDNMAFCFGELGDLFKELHEYAEAEKAFKEAVRLYREIGLPQQAQCNDRALQGVRELMTASED